MSVQRHLLSGIRQPSILPFAAAVTLVLATSGCDRAGDAEKAADLVLRGGRVVTVDQGLPEAEAVAIRGDRIVFVGSDDEVEAFTGSGTEVIDLAGRLAIPGFIEGHGHLMGLGHSRLQLDLMATASYQDLIDMVAEAVAGAQPGEWIVGRGWHQSKWDPGSGPGRARLPDARCPVGGIPGQPGASQACVRARQLRQRAGHGARRG